MSLDDQMFSNEYNTVEQLLNGERPSIIQEFYCRGKKAECSLVVLSLKEQSMVKTQAIKEVKSFLKEALPGKTDSTKSMELLLDERIVIHTLFHCMRQTRDITKYFWPNWIETEDKLTGDDAAILWKKYVDFKIKSNKTLSDINDEEVGTILLEMMKEGTKPEYFLDLLGLDCLKTLVLSLVSQVKNLQTSTISSTEPHANMSPTETNI